MRFENIERFYEQNHQYLLEDNGRRSLRPTKSYTKDILACFEKFKELYLKEGIVEHTKEQFSTFLKVDANTTLQNMRSMQEFGFMNGSFDVSDEDEDEAQSGDNSEDGTYSMTPAFAQLVNSQTNFGSFLFERLSKIRTLDDFTPYLNFLLCTLREAAEYGDIISFGPIAHDKYLKIVTKPEDRQILRSRIFKIYGYCGRRSPGQSESSDNYLPNISYMSFGTLEELGLIKKNKEKNTYGLNTLSLTYSGEYLLKELDKFIGQKDDTPTPKVMNINPNPNKNIDRYLTALRTKPFMLLAGISGTGKSRIVRKLAQASVSESLQREFDPKSVANGFNRWELHKPANFELIQVKPNWHNSLEVVGYKSNIGGAHYEFTPFVEFVARAWKHQDVPFFLCLDEMNLAPVEQYFAEFLSAIESRSIENKEYETDPIIKPFSEFGDDVCNLMLNHLVGKVDASNVVEGSQIAKLVERFKTKGLTLPKNLFVMGTVNMDETTFSFSRKVLDRAMSIVMNDVEYDKFFKGETENDIIEMTDDTKNLLIDRPIRGLIAEDNKSEIVEKYLTEINTVLEDTPFKLGYRAANEALLYVSASSLLQPSVDTNNALDEFTLMKILSRIEGDKRSIGNLLNELQGVITTSYPRSNKKLVKMAETLNGKQFVSYWT